MACGLVSARGWLLQVALGFVAFSILLLKRFREPSPRPWRIWFYDASKQGIAATLVHFVNLLIAKYVDAGASGHDACSWYFMNLLLDCSLGLFVLYWLLRGLASLIRRHQWAMLESGNYGTPPSSKAWLYQLGAYLVVCLGEKTLVGVLCLVSFMKPIGDALLRPIGRASENLELVVAMLLTPLIINAIWFWVVDNLLMAAELGKRRHQNLPYVASLSRGLDGDSDSDEDPRDSDTITLLATPISTPSK